MTDDEPRLLSIERVGAGSGRWRGGCSRAAVRSPRSRRAPHAGAGAARVGARADGPRARLRRAALHLRRPQPRPGRARRRAPGRVDRVPGARARGPRGRRGTRALAWLLRVPALGGRAPRPARASSTASSLRPSRAGSARCLGPGRRAAPVASARTSPSACAGRPSTACACWSATSFSTRPGSSREASRDADRLPGGAAPLRRRADGARPSAPDGDGSRPAARKAEVPAGGVRAAAADASRCCACSASSRRSRARRSTSRTSAAWSRQGASSRERGWWRPTPRAAPPSCSASAARCCASGAPRAVGLPRRGSTADAESAPLTVYALVSILMSEGSVAALLFDPHYTL